MENPLDPSIKSTPFCGFYRKSTRIHSKPEDVCRNCCMWVSLYSMQKFQPGIVQIFLQAPLLFLYQNYRTLFPTVGARYMYVVFYNRITGHSWRKGQSQWICDLCFFVLHCSFKSPDLCPDSRVRFDF